MDIRLLGPVQARAGQAAVDLGPPRQRMAFAALALDAGRPLRPEALTDRLWGQSPPQRARDSLYVHIARLRAALDCAPGLALRRSSAGYVLEVDPLQVDVHRFESLLAAARDRQCPPERRAELLGECLSLWRGEPLADLSGQWVEEVRQSLRAKHLDAMLLWAAAQLELGEAAAVITPLTGMLQAHPFAESLAGLLMRALAASGRTAEALERYAEVRARLADELGTDPSPELQEIHRELLRGERPAAAPGPTRSPARSPVRDPMRDPTRSPMRDPTRDPTRSPVRDPTRSPTRDPTRSPMQGPTRSPMQGPTRSPMRSPMQGPVPSPSSSPSPGEPAAFPARAAVAERDRTAPVPAQLPLDIYGFTGRDPEVKQLNEIADGGGVRLVVIAGTAGVGKTALAVRWAHANAARFGDGQLYLSLRGFEPGADPVTPAEALARLLRGLGMAPAGVPHDLDEASALYRSLMAGKRMLVLLDNVHEARQIRPLLPGTTDGMVVVTSRHRLDGLLAIQGGRLITLEPLSLRHAEALLTTMLGAERVGGDPRVAELARRCAYLPLALRIAAANLATRPAQAIGDYLDRMDGSGALEALHAEGDDLAAVGAAFDASYTQLSPGARRLFRRSSLCGGNGFDRHTAAALCGLSLVDATRLLEQLCAAHLLTDDGENRYGTHDLLRAYARRRLHADETPAERAEAARRLVDFYTDTCYQACLLFNPRRNKSPRDIVHPPLARLEFADLHAAMRWHELEQPNFVGAVTLAAEHGWHRAAWQLAETLYHYFGICRHWRPWLEVTAIGLASAEATGDGEAIARLHICLGTVHKQTGDRAGARAAWERALAEAGAVGLPRLVAGCHVNLGGLCVVEGDPAAGAEHLRHALEFTEYSDDPRYGCIIRLNYGCALLDLDRPEEAEEAFKASLAMAQRAQDDLHVCHGHHNLAEISLRRGDPATAEWHARQQLSAAERIEDPLRQAAAWDMLGSAVCRDDPESARDHWTRALSGYQGINHRLEEPMRQWLELTATMGRDEVYAEDGARRRRARMMI